MLLCLSLLASPSGWAGGNDQAYSKDEQVLSGPEVDGPNGCLQEIWQNQKNPNKEFDLLHDKIVKGRYSCDAFTSASAINTVLERIAFLAKGRDFAALADWIAYPFSVISPAGVEKRYYRKKQIIENSKTIFNEYTISMLTCISLEKISVVRSKGIFWGNGEIWFYVERDGAYPKLYTINQAVKGSGC